MAIDEKYIINRQGKDFVLYKGLIHEAHEKGIQGIETTLIKLAVDKEGEPIYAVARATVTDADGNKWSGIGDANRTNVSRNIAPHLIRMAETRAKARALRDCLDIEHVAFDEINGDDFDESGGSSSRSGASGGRQQGRSTSQSSSGGRGRQGASSRPSGQTNGEVKKGDSTKTDRARIMDLSRKIWGDDRAVEQHVLKGHKIEELDKQPAKSIINGLQKTLARIEQQNKATADDTPETEGDGQGDGDGEGVDFDDDDVTIDEVDLEEIDGLTKGVPA
jgi:hypothetical protein